MEIQTGLLRIKMEAPEPFHRPSGRSVSCRKIGVSLHGRTAVGVCAVVCCNAGRIDVSEELLRRLGRHETQCSEKEEIKKEYTFSLYP